MFAARLVCALLAGALPVRAFGARPHAVARRPCVSPPLYACCEHDGRQRAVAARMRGGGGAMIGLGAPAAAAEPAANAPVRRVRALELVELLFTHAWVLQPWARRLALLLALTSMGTSKLARVRATFSLARLLDAATALVATPSTVPLLLTPAAREIGIFVSYLLLSFLCEELKRLLYSPVAGHAVRSVSVRAFREAHARESEWHDSQPAGGLDRVFHRGSRALQTLMSAVSFSLGPTIFEACLVLVVLARQFGLAVSAAAGLTFALTIAIGVIANERRREMYALSNAQDSALSAHFVESLRGHELVKLSSAEGLEADAYEARVSRLLRVRIALSRSLAALNAAQRAAFHGGLLFILLLALRDARAGLLLPSKLLVLNSLLRQLSAPVASLGSSYTFARQACVDIGGLLELTRAQGSALGADNAEPPPLTAAQLGDGRLVFERVTLQLPPHPTSPPHAAGEPPGAEGRAGAAGGEGGAAPAVAHAGSERRKLLDDVSFSVARGERVALVGPSGAGKTTLLRVLARFVTPSGGRVTLGGRDIAGESARAVRRALAVVPQDCWNSALLAHASERADARGAADAAREPRGADGGAGGAQPAEGLSSADAIWLEEAVRYASPNATAAQIASALDAVGLLPGQWEPRAPATSAEMTPYAARLSAGELQRLALARALVRDAAVLVCDEPTANLDALSAARTTAALRRASADRAVLVVAHDLRTVVDYDRIIVLDQGRVVESGTHAQLLQNRGLYSVLWATQAGAGQ